MYIPKRYGQSKIDSCPFCGKQATTQNKQGVPVCQAHKNREIQDMKCLCGGWLDLMNGKFGPYFNCMKCGNINFKRALEMNPDLDKEEPKKDFEGEKKEPVRRSTQYPSEKKSSDKEKKEIFITSDDIGIYY